MSTWARECAVKDACALIVSHGESSMAEAESRAEEYFTNMDLGGFAHWKSVEQLLYHCGSMQS